MKNHINLPWRNVLKRKRVFGIVCLQVKEEHEKQKKISYFCDPHCKDTLSKM
jgi:hypothetical protein